MKHTSLKILQIILVASLFFTGELKTQTFFEQLEKNNNPNLNQIKEAFEDQWKDFPEGQRKPGWKQMQRWQYFWEPRTFPNGEFPNQVEIYREYEFFKGKETHSNPSSTKQWTLLGPETKPEKVYDVRQQGLGRVNVIRFHPDNPNIIWAGAASGGVWRSKDGGSSWETFPFTQFLSLGVSDIAISPSDPNIVYVATGDASGTLGTGNSFYSIGIIKTTDAGATWNLTNMSYYLSNGKVTSRLILSPHNPDIVIAATSEGIYKTTDGGTTWNLKRTGNFRDMICSISDYNIVSASVFSRSGSTSLFRSSDFGDSWEQVHDIPGASRVVFAVTPVKPNRVYALCSRNMYSSYHSLIISEDNGINYEEYSNYEIENNLLGWYLGTGSDNNTGQADYDLCLAVSPTDSRVLYIGGINVWKSIDEGSTWTMVAHWNGAYDKPFIHADQHCFEWLDESTLFVGNDGGIYLTGNGGKSWNFKSNGMSITQYYRFGVSQTEPYLIYAGCQDNGSNRLNDGKWEHVYSADGMEAAVDPTNTDRVYVSFQYGQLLRSSNGGKNFTSMINSTKTNENGGWVTPYLISSTSPNVIYAGYKNVWKSTDYGVNWNKISNFSSNRTIVALALSEANPNIIYAANYSNLIVSKDGGETWTTILNSSQAITYIEAHPTNENIVWVTLSGYSSGNKVMEYDGSEWNNISGNLPNVPINCIAYQKESPDRIYVGTDIGVFYTDYSSKIWEQFGAGLPNVIVNELEIHYGIKKIRAATYGRGIWEADILECNLEPLTLKIIGNLEFCLGDSVIIEVEQNYPNFVWNNGETSKRIVVKESGSFSVTAEDNTGCTTKSNSVTVEVYNVPELAINPVGKFPICIGEEATLTANFGFKTYLWNNGETTRRIVTSIPGEYYLSAVTSDGCVAYSDTLLVEVMPYPEKPIISQNGNWLNSTEAIEYQWYKNDTLIEGATNHSYLATESGIYKVEIWDEYSCSNISEEFDFILGVNDINTPEYYINVRPNPSKDIFNINAQFTKPHNLNISISTINGERVFSEIVKYNGGVFTKQIDFSQFPRGTYYLVINYDGNIWRHQLIKE